RRMCRGARPRARREASPRPRARRAAGPPPAAGWPPRARRAWPRPASPRPPRRRPPRAPRWCSDRKSTRLNSSHVKISYAVFSLSRRSPRSTLFPYTTLFRSSPHVPRSTTSCSPGGKPSTSSSTRSRSPSCRRLASPRSAGVAPASVASASSAPPSASAQVVLRSEEHTSELQSRENLVCRLFIEPAIPEIYALSLHDALPIFAACAEEHDLVLAGRQALDLELDAQQVPLLPQAGLPALGGRGPGQRRLGLLGAALRERPGGA